MTCFSNCFSPSSSPSPVPFGGPVSSIAPVCKKDYGIGSNDPVEPELSTDSPISTAVEDSAPNDVLGHPLEGAEPVIQVFHLIQSAATSFDHIRTLYDRKITHRRLPLSLPKLKPFKKEVDRAVRHYLKAVESSMDIAQQGVNFATNAVYLCDAFGDQQKLVSDRDQFMNELEQIGLASLSYTQWICDAFDHVQRSFYEIVGKMDQRMQHKEFNLVETSGQSFTELQHFPGKVFDIFKCSQNFVRWWADMKVMLRMCKDSAITAGDQPMSTPRIDLLRKKWEAVGERFQDYSRSFSSHRPQSVARCGAVGRWWKCGLEV